MVVSGQYSRFELSKLNIEFWHIMKFSSRDRDTPRLKNHNYKRQTTTNEVPVSKRALSVRSISFGGIDFTPRAMQEFGILIFLHELATTSCVTTK